MSKQFIARIKWLSKEEGGREVIPFGDKYAPIIILKNEKYDFSMACWSIYVNNIKKINNFETYAILKYLSDKAPDNLKIGTEFKLFEGAKLVATGNILEKVFSYD